jgi:glutathione S-transferase
MKLHYAPQSPFARKVRAAAIELGLGGRIDLEYTEVVPGHPNRAFGLSYNPLRKIPALVIDDGTTIYDSTVICEYLDDLAGGGIIIPQNGSRRWRVLTNHALAQGLCDSVILIRYENWLRPEALRWSSWTDEHWDKINSGLAWFDQNNAELGGSVNIAHLALGSLLGYVDFRWPEHGWRDRFPSVSGWFAELECRPSFLETRPTVLAQKRLD